MKESMGDRIKKLREARGLTQEQLAEKASFASGTISKWEIGAQPIGKQALIKLAQFFNVSVDYLLGLEVITPTPLKNPLDDMLNELANMDPDLVARFRSTGENWSRFSDEEKLALIDGLNFVLRRSISPRLKMIGKDEGI